MDNKLDVNPWLSMWVRPRATIQAIGECNVRFRYLTLCFFYGFPLMLQLAQSMALGISYSFFGILLGCLFLAPFLGMLGLSVSAALLYIVGRWLGGKASFLSVRSAIAWSNVTNIVTTLLWIPLLVMFSSILFTDAFISAPFTTLESGFVTALFIGQLVLSLWSLFLLIQSLAQVQNFSSWRSFANIFVSFVMSLVILWGVGFVFFPK